MVENDPKARALTLALLHEPHDQLASSVPLCELRERWRPTLEHLSREGFSIIDSRNP